MDLEIRPIVADEVYDFLRAERLAFGQPIGEDELAAQQPLQELDRSLAAFEDGRIVGGAHSRSFRMNVSGEQLPTCGVMDVSVQATHRRRGILTRLMARQLQDVHERGEPLAALYASESIIYGRFGYGIGAVHEKWTIDRRHTDFALPREYGGSCRFVTTEEMRDSFPEIHRRATTGRPGAIQPTAQRWDRIAEDPLAERAGAGRTVMLVYETDGLADGYAHYRNKDGTLIVMELMSVTDAAHAALWRFCLDVDLMAATEAWARPVDDPLPWMLADPRRLDRTPVDGLWVRLVDVPEALSGRAYSVSGKVVLGVRDSFCPWNEGRYELEAGPEGARCRPTDAEPDIELSAADLAAAYLGTVSFSTLSQAGRVEQRTPGALRIADAMFADELKPWCPFSF